MNRLALAVLPLSLGLAGIAFAQTMPQATTQSMPHAMPQSMPQAMPSSSQPAAPSATKPAPMASSSSTQPAPMASTAGAPAMHHVRHIAAAHPDSSEAQRETTALNLLEAKGYGNFKDFHAEGKGFTASTTSGGTTHTISIDPDSGTVNSRG